MLAFTRNPLRNQLFRTLPCNLIGVQHRSLSFRSCFVAKNESKPSSGPEMRTEASGGRAGANHPVGELPSGEAEARIAPDALQQEQSEDTSCLSKPQLKKEASRAQKGSAALQAERLKIHKQKAKLMVAQELKRRPPLEPIAFKSLNDEQKAAATKILSGRNAFITGGAGTGKTHLLRYLIQELRKEHGEKSVAVTAPTGIAAIHIDGQTVHSFAGMGIDENAPLDETMARQSSEPDEYVMDQWRQCQVLVIDEISMLSGSLFEELDEIARTARGDEAPFGGIQLIVVGDFLQLPPVPPQPWEMHKYLTRLERLGKERNNSSTPSRKQKKRGTLPRDYCFLSPLWEAAGLGEQIHLTKMERQSDAEFVKHLNDVRLGVLTKVERNGSSTMN